MNTPFDPKGELYRVHHEVGNCIVLLQSLFDARSVTNSIDVSKRISILEDACVKRLQSVKKSLNEIEEHL